MVRIGTIINTAIWGGLGYLVYKNWGSLQKIGGSLGKLGGSVFKGAETFVTGSVGILEKAGDKLADLTDDGKFNNSNKPKQITPQQALSNVINDRSKKLRELGWTTPEEIARGINLDYDKRNIRKETTNKKKSNDKLSNVKSTKSGRSASSLRTAPKPKTSSKVSKLDSLSGKDKGKGSYIVTKSDGSKVKRFFQ